MSERMNLIAETDAHGVADGDLRRQAGSHTTVAAPVLSSHVMAAPMLAAQQGTLRAASSDVAGLSLVPAAAAPAHIDAQAQALAQQSMAIGFAAMKSGDLSVLDGRLLAHYYENAGMGTQMAGFIAANADVARSVHEFGGHTYITIDASAKDGDGAALLTQLQAIGLVGGASYHGVASGFISTDHIADLIHLSNLGHVRESLMGLDTGSVTSQSDRAEYANRARDHFSVDGSGVKIGVISDSFDTYHPKVHGTPDSMASNIATGDLPSDTTILQDMADGTDEGRGMGQLIHDLAPGAAIEFATADGGQANFANNIERLADAGAQIIVDDVYYFDEPMFQDGIVAQALDDVVTNKGVTYFSSAGNKGIAGWTGEFNTDAGDKTIGLGDGSLEAAREQFMEFAPGQDYLEVDLRYYDTILLSWDQPSTAAGNASGATGDLDFYLTNQDGSIIYRSSEYKNIGDEPYEELDIAPAEGQPVLHAGPIYLRVGYYAGATPEHVRIIDLHNKLSTSEYQQSDSTSFGHTAAEGSISVAAARYADTPEYGTDPAQAEYFSTKGPGIIWLDKDGHHLDHAEIRHHPQITAVDGGNTTFFGSDDDDPDAHPNFYGTSAAAPDAAAVAALMLDANSSLTQQDILNLMMASASDMDDASTPGFDTGRDARTGAGLIDAKLSVYFALGNTIANRDQAILDGTHLDDKIVGSARDNELNGGAGDDKLVGRGGADSLLGGAGVDHAYGRQGDDQLGSRGDGDFLDGGTGNDTYIFTDLQNEMSARLATLSNSDKIDLSLIDTSTADGDQGFAKVSHFTGSGEAELMVSYNANSDRTLIRIDLDGNGEMDHQIVVNGDHHNFNSFVL